MHRKEVKFNRLPFYTDLIWQPKGADVQKHFLPGQLKKSRAIFDSAI